MKRNKLIIAGFVLTGIILAITATTAAVHEGCSTGAAASVSCGMPGETHSTSHDPNTQQHGCSSEIMQKYSFIATMPIYLDSPTVIYARAEELGLSQEQKAKLLTIIDESRKAALALLAPEQKQKLGDISNGPITMSQICPKMNAVSQKTSSAASDAKIVEQTVCPVMGMEINKNIFVEYKGQKVYFCCPDCKGKFQADPEKYLPKLPQFSK